MDTSQETQHHEDTNILSCPLCSHKLKEPKQLECHCIFCRKCINHAFHDLRSQDCIKCPKCTKELQNPPELKDAPQALQSLLDTVNTTRYECESRGCHHTVRYPYICVNCYLWLCQTCRKLPCEGSIKEIHSEPGHVACAKKYLTPGLFQILVGNISVNMCKSHEKRFDFYCEDCEVNVCEMGRTDRHVDHTLTDIKKKSNDYMGMLLTQKVGLKKKMADYKKAQSVYRYIIEHPVPFIVNLDQCRAKETWCQQRNEKCDDLVRCITHLEKFACIEVVLEIGKEKQKDISDELKLCPLDDLDISYKWFFDIVKRFKLSQNIDTENIQDRTTSCESRLEMNNQNLGPAPVPMPADQGLEVTNSVQKTTQDSLESHTPDGTRTDSDNPTGSSPGPFSSPGDDRMKKSGSSKRKSTKPIKRTIQTRSVTSKLIEDQHSRPKRPRVMPIPGDTGTIGERLREGRGKTRKGTEGSFKRLGASSVTYADFTMNSTVDEARVAIATVVGKNKRYVTIVDRVGVVAGSTLVKDILSPLHVVVRNIRRAGKVTPNFQNDGRKISMSCGHEISQEKLYRHCWNQITNEQPSFRCLEDEGCCNVTWTIQEVTKKACLSTDERVIFESLMNLNYSAKTQRCPVCLVECKRRGIADACVLCTNCENGFQFCWYCHENWTLEHACDKSMAQRLLTDCKRTEVANIKGCPVRRACPKCGNFIEYENNCKYMICSNRSCRCMFCFVCLSVVGGKGFACASFDDVCEVAPIQIVTYKDK